MAAKQKTGKKRSPGEASYRKRADGSWEGRITINYKPHSVYGKSRAECKEKIGDLKEMLSLGVSRSSLSLAEWLETWLHDYVAMDKKPSTIANYETIARLHLVPELGRVRIDKITQTDVQRLIARKSRTQLAAKTVRLIHHVLRCCLNAAMAHKMLAANPAHGVILPRMEHGEMATIQPADILQLQNADLFETEPLFPCVILMVYTGLRRGEALALRWSDVDLDRGALVVQREIVKVAGGTLYQSPKTRNSNRLVPFGELLIDLLRRHKQRQDLFKKNIRGYKDEDLIFARENGSPYYPDSFRKILHRILAKAGIPNVRVHDLRHTCATLLMMSGVNPKVVQEILGHSNINVTLGTYSHTMPSMKRLAADSLGSFVAASKTEPAKDVSSKDDPAPAAATDENTAAVSPPAGSILQPTPALLQ